LIEDPESSFVFLPDLTIFRACSGKKDKKQKLETETDECSFGKAYL